MEDQQKLKIADVVTALEAIKEWLGIVIITLRNDTIYSADFGSDVKPDKGIVLGKVSALGARVGKDC